MSTRVYRLIVRRYDWVAQQRLMFCFKFVERTDYVYMDHLALVGDQKHVSVSTTPSHEQRTTHESKTLTQYSMPVAFNFTRCQYFVQLTV